MNMLAHEIVDEYDGAVPSEGGSEDPSPQLATQLPEPKGYKLLIALPEVAEATEGGIIKSLQSQHEESISTVVGWVMSMGPDAYANFSRFPTGPYCKVGDWVVFRAFSGTRIKIHGKEFRLINDDTVEAVVEDPRGVERA
jgi:co-chaperonin GroES (HSP10)|tara:strand:+ start:355 stop:774 length:420 start_codon:yes stop_codon:yes gene_type:complete